MARKDYLVNGERRKHRHIDIWYDAERDQWYVRTWETIASGISIERRTYFSTISEGKRFIDEFFTASAQNIVGWSWD